VKEGHLERILGEAGGRDVLDILAERLAPTDLQSLLLEVYRRRAASVTPAQVMAQYAQSRFVCPSPADPRSMNRIEALAFEAAEQFDAVELAPVCPFGTVSALGGVSQNRVVSTARNTEVVADPTNCMALECAVRRRAGVEVVRLCASHRVVRAQDPGKAPMSFAHFAIFALCTAGRDTGSLSFDFAALREHLRFYVGFLMRLRDWDVRVSLTDWDGTREAELTENVVRPLQAEFPAAEIGFNPGRTAARGYYKRFAFDVSVGENSVVDGGFTDWTAELLSNRKERLLISGIGLERICLLCDQQPK
jgi:hypothetical protein